MAGTSLAPLLVKKVSAGLAVESWIISNPALGELERECEWFRPLLSSVAFELASRATLGASLRAYYGAAVSFADMISDTFIIIQYFGEGCDSYAFMLLGIVGAKKLSIYNKPNNPNN